ncbi:Branched-chain amino acid aminotransferase [Seminavis robusta]|uniref:Branched-chain-amino-acid aminotransferase n=1 Tax=Seminavis robusta TaxID=568900 RepID=A0A9N8DLN3_9STRA|nr:Branched-chain amino acid aminotransferase [Seminavis robusta]|eukprot:Sro200_g084810.1 Branched-chain amino acid aminotransferase (390) ;mRNA; f:61525-62806
MAITHPRVWSIRGGGQHAPPKDNIDWESFGFGLNNVRTDKMWLDRVSTAGDGDSTHYSTDDSQCLVPLGDLQLSPTATVLNYGQALFEGLKACRRPDGSIAIFRPDKNAQRMAQGAERFCMPVVPERTFLHAVDAVVRENAAWVPPHGQGALYLRPLLMGTGEGLGVKPSSESTFCIYASPVGNYFKGGIQAIRLQAVQGFSRAAAGGSGAIKASGNYAPAFAVQRQVKQRGFDEVLCLDAASGEAVEEAGASNFFAIFPDNTIVTPSLQQETILPGVTRQSILELAAAELGLTPVERRLTLEELKQAKEAFCCGTGACISPVGSISVAQADGNVTDEIVFGSSAGPLTEKLFRMLTGIQTGSDATLSQKYRHWIHVVEPANQKVAAER